MPRRGEATLTIGSFARRSRLSPKALRLYDRLGVLSPAEVDEHTGYRLYSESQLEVARLVGLLRRLEMPLTQVARVAAAPPEEQAELLERHWTQLEGRFAAQRELMDHLRTRLSGDERPFERYLVEERDVPEQRVLTALRHTTVSDLSPWLGETLTRLSAEAAVLGRGGPSFVVFHGEVNEDSDGPVEVCAPIRTTDVLSAPNRSEPAHREAFTAITVAQVAFPQILSAYEAVERWIAGQHREMAGSPREVYVDGFDRLSSDDVGCEIAFPVTPPPRT